MAKIDQYIKNDELHNLLELPWKKSFILLLRKKSLDNIFNTYFNSFSPFLQKNYHLIKDFTLLDPFRLENNIQLLNRISNIPGDIVECGCFKGGNALLMALWLKENRVDKKIILFDSFEGLPSPNLTNNIGYNEGQFAASLDFLNNKIDELNLKGFFEIHKGWFSNSIPKFLEDSKDVEISMLHIDCDLYESTIDSFPLLYNKVVSNGVVILDDFNDGARGEKLAVLESLNDPITFFIGPTPQSFFFKTNEIKIGIPDSGHYYCFDELKENKSYLNWIMKVTDINYLNLIDKINITND
jgi:hypothetical protein